MSNGNGAPRNPSHELIVHLKNFREMAARALDEGNGPAPIDTDPKKVVSDLFDYLDFARKDVLDLPLGNWSDKIGGELISATELAKYIDMEFPWLIEPLLCRGFLTQIQGVPKGGKSAFSLWLCLLAAMGEWNRIPTLEATPATPLKVLYLAWEDPKIMMAKRLSMYALGLGYQKTFLPENITFLFAPTFFANRSDHTAALSEAVKNIGADILVIDTLSHSHECKENVAEEMRIPMNNLNQMCQALNISVVYIHHTSKGSGDKNDWEKARGSTAIAAAWHILIDWGQREKGSDINPVQVQSKLGVEASWNVHYNKHFDDLDKPKKLTSVNWEIEPQEKEESGNEKLDKRKRKVLETLGRLFPTTPEGPTAKQVQEACGLPLDVKTVKRYLNEEVEEGRLNCKTGAHGIFHYTPLFGGL